MEKNLKKNTIWNIIGTGINAFASLIFMIIVTRINNIYEAGIFSFAFSSATLFNVIGTYAGRVYQVTDTKGISNKEYIINRLITCFSMIIVAIAFVIIRGYELYKIVVILLLCVLKMLEAFCDVIYGFFQKENNLYKVGVSLTAKNIIGLIVFFVVDFYSKNIIIAISSFIFVYILFMIAYDFYVSNFRQQMIGKVKKENVIYILKNGFPIFCQTFLNIYIINASKYAIDNIMPDNYQTIFGIIVMPATMMLLVTQFMVHPFLNVITNYVKENEYKSLNKLIIKISLIIVGLGVIAIVFCYFIGIYILELIYGISLVEFNSCLSIILAGSICSALTSIVLTVLIAMRKNIIQMIVYAGISIFTLIISNLLVKNLGIIGASINYALTMIINFFIFVIVYLYYSKLEDKK